MKELFPLEASFPDRLPPLLPRSFYARDALSVARGILGMLLCHEGVVLRITEVEAYRWPDDSANHGRHGLTERNAPLWGPPGTAYLYLCYGVHVLLNLVTGREGEAQAVLVRAAEPLAGHEQIRARRRGRLEPAALAGPAKVAAALGLTLAFNGQPVYRPGGLEVRRGWPPARVLAGPRIGVDYARPAHRRAPWRLADGESRWVSHRRSLRPLARTPVPSRPQAPSS